MQTPPLVMFHSSSHHASLQVDVNKLAEVCNFGSVGSARVCWSTVRKKILTGDDGAASTVTAPKSKTGGSKGKTATAASKKRHATKAEDEEQAAEVAVPVKKPRGRKKKLPTAAVPQGANSNEDQDDEI